MTIRRMFDSAIIKELVFDVEPAKTKGEEHTDESYATVVMPANKCQLEFFMQRRLTDSVAGSKHAKTHVDYETR